MYTNYRPAKFTASIAFCFALLFFQYNQAFAQAVQTVPAEQCFQATTGINGMIGLLGTLTGGSGGTTGTYTNVAITGGSGTAATATITVSGGAVTQVSILNPGINYVVGDSLSASSADIGNVSGFSVLVSSISINSSLAGGTVGMYVPGTLTYAQTWQNAGQTINNTNPITLDGNGCAIIYGIGTYRQILYDRLGNEVWDQLTSVAPVNPYWANIAGGTANAITVVDPAFAGTDGQAINFIAYATNTGSVTINPSSYGNIPVVKNTSSGPESLVGGEIVAGNQISVIYSATYSEFFLTSETAQTTNIAAGTGIAVTGSSPITISNTFYNTTDLYLNPQWQILDNASALIDQRGPQSLTALPSFSITGTNTGSALICYTVSGSPTIQVGDLVALSGGTINAALLASNGHYMHVTSITGSPVTQFCARSPLGVYGPGSSETGTGQLVNKGDTGSSLPRVGQDWTKSAALQFWPTRYTADIGGDAAVRALGLSMGGSAGPLYIYQTLSYDAYTALAGQTVTNRWRVEQLVKGGSGTSQAFCNLNGTEYDGTAAVGVEPGKEDVTLSVAFPTTFTAAPYCGLRLNGAANDLYYVDDAMLVNGPSLPANYFKEVTPDWFFSTQDIVPVTLNGASLTFPSSADPTGVYYTLYGDMFADTDGLVDWTVTAFNGALEGKCTSAGVAMDLRNILGDSGGDDIIYGTSVYNELTTIFNSASERIPLDTGDEINSVAPGFFFIFSPTSAASCSDVSLDVQEYRLN